MSDIGPTGGRWCVGVGARAWFTIAWNAVEGVTSIVAGLAAGSIALVGFGVDP